MTKLRLSADLTLPLEAITETIAILGIRGSGKTNSAAVYAEELLSAGQQVVILDPTDAWWGLKSSADGQKAAFPVVVLGGKHADLPLNSGDGKLVAEFAVEQGASVICSLRGFESKTQELAFATAFLRRLYHLKGQQDTPTPLALMIDEASRLVPQRVMGEDAACVGAVQQIVRQGRSSGFGVVLIDQRAATVNKDVLAQLEMMIVHRTTGPQDRKALKEWIEAHDTEGHEKEFLSSLASLAQGEAWFWSPGWLDIFRRVQVRARKTFDSSRTPRAGEVVVAPKAVASVDLEALRGKMAETIERAKADDPKELRKEIAALKKQLASAPVKSIEKPVVDERAIARAVASAVAAERTKLAKIAKRIESQHNTIGRALEEIAVASKVTRDLMLDMNDHSAEDSRAGARVRVERNDATGVTTGWKPPRQAQRPAVEPNADASIGGTPQRILNALLFLETVGTSPASRQAIAGLVGVSWDTGTFRTYLSQLRALGLINDGTSGSVSLTDEGRSRANDDGLPTTRKELHHAWLSKLGGRPRMLAELLATYPQALDRESLGEACGIDASTGTFRTYLSQLRSLGLITDEGKHAVRAADALFPEGLR